MRRLTMSPARELEREVSPHYCEITDRGSNFQYLPPERRAKLAEFFAMAQKSSRSVARED